MVSRYRVKDRLSPEWRRQRRRYELGQFRAEMAEEFGCHGARTCMHPGGDVVVHVGVNGAPHVSGVMRCGGVGLCPTCAPVIRQRRAGDIEAAAEAWRLLGGETWLATFTIPHGVGDELGSLLDQLRGMWRALGSSTGYRNWRKDCAIEGVIKVVEVTYGANGWHPHLHVLFFGKRSRFDVRRLAELWRKRFDIEDLGYVPHVSFDARRLTGRGIGAYLGKVQSGWGAGAELARGDLKAGSLTPAELLDLAAAEYAELDPAAVTTGEVVPWRENPAARWLHLWEELERGSKNVRWIEWGKGLRARAGGWQMKAVVAGHELRCELLTVDEASDVEAARGADAEHVAASWHVPGHVWLRFRRAGQLGLLLQALISNDGERYGAWRIVCAVDPDWVPRAGPVRGPPAELIGSS